MDEVEELVLKVWSGWGTGRRGWKIEDRG